MRLRENLMEGKGRGTSLMCVRPYVCMQYAETMVHEMQACQREK